MASLQCYRTSQESCEVKSHDNSFGHKLSEMAGKVFKGNHNENHASSHGHCYGKTHGHHPSDHNMTQTYYSDHTMAKTQSTYCVSQPHGHHGIDHSHGHAQSGHHAMGYGQSGQHMGQHSSHGLACYGKRENKKKTKCEHSKKENCHCNKRRHGNGSCSDSSDSD